jgi:hypothetical protein
MNDPISERIATAIIRVEKEATKPGAYGYLPTIARVLESMQSKIHAPLRQRDKTAGALGKLVLDDSHFSSGRLGLMLLKLADDFASPEL